MGISLFIVNNNNLYIMLSMQNIEQMILMFSPALRKATLLLVIGLLSGTVAIAQRDYGDASSVGEVSIPTTGMTLMLGISVDNDASGLDNATATGDDNNGIDDEDGVSSWPVMKGGKTVNLSTTMTTTVSGYINLWIDYDNDGVFQSSENSIADQSFSPGTISLALVFTPPATAVAGVPVAARLIISSGTMSSAIGSKSGTGEIEDYMVTFLPAYDNGDASEVGNAAISPGNETRLLGALVDTEIPSLDVAAEADDFNGIDDEDGVATWPAMTPGVAVTMNVGVTNTSGATSYLNLWIDYNDNGIFDAGENPVANQSVIAGATSTSITFTPPLTVVNNTPLVARLIISSATLSAGTGTFTGNGEVEDYKISFLSPYDYGDRAGVADAWIAVSLTKRLGSLVDTELVPVKNTAATGDDNTGIDDEDGVSSWPTLTLGKSVTVNVAITNSGTSYLNLWIDYDNDGVFESTERPISNKSTTATSSIALTFTPPLTAVWDVPLAARLMISSGSQSSAEGLKNGTGEIEDYALTLNSSFDFGDASSVPAFWINADPAFKMGAALDLESVATRNATATGDDNTGADDEDAISAWPASMKGGTSTSVTVNFTGTRASTGYLWLFIDYDNSGTFDKTTEAVSSTAKSVTASAASATFTFTPPISVVSGTPLAARLIFISSSSSANIPVGVEGLSSTTTTVIGEVEDYMVTFDPIFDYGDAPSIDMAWIRASSTLYAGALASDVESTWATNATATSDDIGGVDDEDGIVWPELITGQNASIPITGTGSPAYINLWIDFNSNGVFESTERVVTNVTSFGSKTVAVPATAEIGVPIAARLSVTSASLSTTATPRGVGLLSTTAAGEVEDYMITVSPPIRDYSDDTGPAPAYCTIVPGLSLGRTVDGEVSENEDANASGDDLNSSDDEDALYDYPPFTENTTVPLKVFVTNNTASAAYLNVWIDWGNDGSYASTDREATNMVVAAGFVGEITVNVTVPASVTLTTVTGRFILTTAATSSTTGSLGMGEVEDHLLVTTNSGTLMDFGDSNMPVAWIIQSTAVKLGTAVTDTETFATAQRNSLATGDDGIGTDDEDAITTLPVLTAGSLATISGVRSGATAGYLSCWIDFNNNGSFADAEDQVLTNLSVAGIASGTVPFSFTVQVPADAAVNTPVPMRLRLANGLTTNPYLLAGFSGAPSASGEIEDYMVTILPTVEYDYGDYLTFGTAYSAVNPDLHLGQQVDADPLEFLTLISTSANADDITTTNDDDGISGWPIREGSTMNLPVYCVNNTVPLMPLHRKQ